MVCPGGQGDVSVYGNLLFMSVEQTRGRLDCGTQGVPTPVSAERFRGVRIFDITDLNKPKQVAAVQTCRGSHTHTMVDDPHDKANLYIYGSGTGSVRSGDELAGCSGRQARGRSEHGALQHRRDRGAARGSGEREDRQPAAHLRRRRPRATRRTVEGRRPRPRHAAARATPTSATTSRSIPEIGLAAGACSGNGILLDIQDPKNPVRLDDVADKNFAYWHSATFNNDGTKVIFTDEWGGGGRPRCRATDLLNWGADAIFDIVDRRS